MAHKIGILGMGSIGSRHAEHLKKLGREIFPSDPAASLCTRDEALDRSDAIVIASPTNQHYNDLADALATKKPVFCEKPIAHVAHHSFSRTAMVGYNLRFHPCVIAAKEWVGQIGTIFSADFMCAQYNDKYKDNVVLNWSHEIDLAHYLLGQPNYASIMPLGIFDKQKDTHVSAKVIWALQGKPTLVTMHLDYLANPEIRQFLIIGSEGQIIVDLYGRQSWLRDTRGQVIDTIDETYTSYDDDYLDEMKEFIGILEGDRPYNRGCNGEEALQALETCRSIMDRLK